MPTISAPRFVKRASAAGGTYWTAPQATKAELRRHLVGLATRPGRLKEAAIGGDQEGQFEQSFASLSYAYMKDKAPRLLDFIVGFQLVDRNEDNTKAVGITGFKVGDQWLYGPTFFLNGDLKGHELLYIKDQDAFVPMKENWINDLISRKPHTLGAPSPRPAHQLGGLAPDLRRVTQPPQISKYGSDAGRGPRVAAWAGPFLPFLATVAVRDEAKLFRKHAGLADRFDLRGFLGEFPLLRLAYERGYRAYPAIKQGFDRFYGPDFFAAAGREALAGANDLVKQARSYILPPRRKPKPKPAGRFLVPPPEPDDPAEKRAGLLIYVRDPVSGRVVKAADTKPVDPDAPAGMAGDLPLDDAERQRLMRDTVLIKDERDPHAVSVAYNTQVCTTLVNPDATGIYRVLERPGAFSEMVLVAAPVSGRGTADFSTLVRKADPRSWLNAHRSALWARQDNDVSCAEFSDYAEGLDKVTALKRGGTYIALTCAGEGTCPFRVREDFGDGVYRVEWLDSAGPGLSRSGGMAPYPRDDYSPDYTPWDAVIRVKNKGSSRIQVLRGEVLLPADARLLTIEPPAGPEGPDDLVAACGCAAPGGTHSATPPIQPGNLADIQMLLHEKTASGDLARLALHDLGGGEILVKARGAAERMTKKAALIALVRDHGLGQEQARAMLKEAGALLVRNAAVEYLIKYAAPYDALQPGPGAPAFPEPIMGAEPVGYNTVPAIYPQEELLPVPELNSYLTDPALYDPFYLPDPAAMAVAQNAAGAGQKEVFDTSMVAGMLKAVRRDSLVDRYLGDLMKALDKLGRILFMFYWHQEEFIDRYGKADVPELEDALRNAFEVLGDVVLKLKEKGVGGGAAVDLGGGTEPDAVEPSVVEAARN